MKKETSKKAAGIKGALTRKLGPLPVWIWAAVLFAGVYYWRNRLSGGQSGTGTGSVGPAATTPQAQTVLDPGQSVYDPNTGALDTAPGGGGGLSDNSSGTGTSGNDLIDALNGLTDALTSNTGGDGTGGPGSGSSSGGSGTGTSGGTAPTAPPPPPSTKSKRKVVNLRVTGREGKRRLKPKPHHRKPSRDKIVKPPHHNKHKPRSGASVKNKAGGRTGKIISGVKNKAMSRHHPAPTATAKRGTSRHVHAIVGHATVRQRPVASSSPHTQHSAQPSNHRAPQPGSGRRKPAPHHAPPHRRHR